MSDFDAPYDAKMQNYAARLPEPEPTEKNKPWFPSSPRSANKRITIEEIRKLPDLLVDSGELGVIYPREYVVPKASNGFNVYSKDNKLVPECFHYDDDMPLLYHHADALEMFIESIYPEGYSFVRDYKEASDCRINGTSSVDNAYKEEYKSVVVEETNGYMVVYPNFNDKKQNIEIIVDFMSDDKLPYDKHEINKNGMYLRSVYPHSSVFHRYKNIIDNHNAIIKFSKTDEFRKIVDSVKQNILTGMLT